jgi:hypothetical protein
VNDYPNGYPNLATFLDSDENFMMCRRFGHIQALLLLDKQDELRVLEEKLDILNGQAYRADPWALTSRHAPGEQAKDRKSLLKEIGKAFCEYCTDPFANPVTFKECVDSDVPTADLVQAARQLVSCNPPAEPDYKSVENYIWNRGPVCEKESSWIYHKEDLIALRGGTEHAWLDSSIEKLLRLFHCGLIEVRTFDTLFLGAAALTVFAVHVFLRRN